jgi:anti-sigma factor RsiW
MKRRDLELLSAYLDGELKQSDSTKLENRLKTDPELASVLTDLRATRTLLRRLPSRKAPRNFTLTRKMAGQNPPLPRSYPAFRFATALATLLFFFTIGLNFVGAQLAAEPQAFGMGGGGSGGVEFYAEESAPALEAPAAEPASTEPATGDQPSTSLAPQGTEIPPAGDEMRVLETPSTKSAEGENALEQQQTTDDAMSPSPLVPRAWQRGFLIAAVMGVVLMQLMRRSSASRWK